MKYLHLIPSVDPSGGGPIEGALRLHEALVALGHSGEFACVDHPDAPFVAAFPARTHALGPASNRYGYSAQLVPWLSGHAGNYDAVIVNGLWQFPGFAARRALGGSTTPYFVFTHGMLDPWFKRRYPLKHLKKWLYWPWGEYRVLRDAAAVLFTCDEERLLARQSFWLYRCNEVVVSYGTSSPPTNADELERTFFASFPELQGKKLFLFLGRIHEKKGCDLLIEAFANVCAGRPDIRLVMAGPDQEGWMPQLQQMAKGLGISDQVVWPGMLSGDLKWGAFYACDVFCLPSHQENFGIAVVEALACGRPVLISDKVNIWREIEADQAGLVATDSLDGTIDLLQRWLVASPERVAQMRTAARQCFDERFRIDAVASKLAQVVLAHTAAKGSPRAERAGAPV